MGKSKLVERFLLDGYKPHQLSTYALTLFRHNFTAPDGREIPVDIWYVSPPSDPFPQIKLRRFESPFPIFNAPPPQHRDTAGQERFNSLHPSYYYKAHACIMVFDVTRKVTYKNLERWYDELQQHCKGIPTFLVANKIDVNYAVTEKRFGFAEKHNLPFTFVSASDGCNVVKVR